MAVNLAARYVHGEWTALVTGYGTAVLDPSIDDDRVHQVWAALSEGRGVSGCLEVLAADGFANLPSFALVQHGEDELRVLVRGEVEVTAGESTVGAAGIATWREALLPGQSYRVEVAGDGAAHPEWPLSAGVVLASRVEWLGSGDGAGGAAAGATALAGEGEGAGDEAGDDGDGDPEPAPEAEPEADASAEAVVAGVGAVAPVVAAAVVADDADADADADAAAAAASAEAEAVDPDVPVGGGVPAEFGEQPTAEDLNRFEETESASAVDAPEDLPAQSAPEEEHSGDASVEEDTPQESRWEDASVEDEAADENHADESSAGTPDEPSDEHGEFVADADSPADALGDSSAHTAEEESAPSPEASAPSPDEPDEPDEPGAVADQDYATDAPTLTASGSDIIDSLPWAVSASDREEARAAQEQTASAPPATPMFDEPPASTPAPAPSDESTPFDASGSAPAPDDDADDLPEQTVVSRPGAEAPFGVPPAPEATQAPEQEAPAADNDVISVDSLMAQQVPQTQPQDYPQPTAGAAFGAPAPADHSQQAYQNAGTPYGSGAAFGMAAGHPAAPPPWAPPADMAPGGPAAQQGQGDVDIEGDHDGETIMVSQLPTDHAGSAAPGTGESDLYDEPHAAPQPNIRLELSTGVNIPLDRPVLIGRAPESARFNAGVQPRLVTVASPEQDISRTHVEMRAEGGHAVVTDLNSTNGTVVVQPGSPPRRLHPGEGASVPTGTVVDLGDGVTVTVQPGSQEAG